MDTITRLPAVPIILNDPYFSIWSAADRPTDAETTHWAGEDKPLYASVTVDGVTMRLLGLGGKAAMPLVSSSVTATKTEFVYEARGIRAFLTFVSPLLMDDPDVLSASVTYGEIRTEAIDGQEHSITVRFEATSQLCCSGQDMKPMDHDSFTAEGLPMAWVGQKRQKPLSNCGDHITIDWGYLWLASAAGPADGERGLSISAENGLKFLIGYDDIASINYFGRLMPAWYARNGKSIVEMLCEMNARREEILEKCAKLDALIDRESREAGGEDYACITAAAYRHCLAAHKLIADENGDPVFLSKENDSNGCIGTVDVSYPSIPLMLRFNPEFVRALCRPVLKFANRPVWTYDFAPHDVGRYPNATGQVYGLKKVRAMNGDAYPPFWLYPSTADAYEFHDQMPVEECGNMLIMLAAAWYADGDTKLVRAYLPTLEKWVRYLIEYGEDPGEQLCTDDFAGHLARNINLSAKATCGVAAYGMLRKAIGDTDEGEQYLEKAHAMAESWLRRADAGDHTALTFDGIGWSMKYNMVWDKLFGLHLLEDSFYEREDAWYRKVSERYGLPLDSRSDYTKSDWIMWTAAMMPKESMPVYVAPMVRYLKETPSRVAFSDWYDVKNATYQAFIGRSVQGGLFMPLLRAYWDQRK